MKSVSRIAACIAVLITLFFFSGCGNGGGGGNSITVSLSQSGSTTTLDAGGSAVTLTASVNDTSNAGVTWALSPSSGCGTLTSSGTTATYTPPAEATANADCAAAVSASSVANIAKAATISFTVKAPTLALSQSGSATTVNAGSAPISLTAAIAHDTSNGGATWSLTPSSGCGTLTSSATTATYTPPAESSLIADCTASVKAILVGNSSKTATIPTPFTIKAVAIALPAGESTSPTLDGNGTTSLSATIAYDNSGSATLDWSITNSVGGNLRLRRVSRAATFQTPAGCGSLSATTGNSVIYAANPVSRCTDTVTVSTSVNSAVMKTFLITVNPPLSITSNASLTNAAFGTAYSATLAATGGVSPYTWSLAQGSMLPPGLTLTSSGLLSGTPSAAGTYGFTVNASDSYSPPVAQQTFSLTVNKAALTVTANNATKTYGQADPSYSVKYTGLLNGDTSSAVSGVPSFSVTGTSGTARPVGIYTITPSLGTLTAANYTFATFNVGNLAVSPGALTPSVTASGKTYDGTIAATITGCSLTGVLSGDTGAVSCSATAAAFSSASAGTGKTVTATGISLGGPASGNYTLSSTTATTTANITAQALTVTAVTSTKTYDG